MASAKREESRPHLRTLAILREGTEYQERDTQKTLREENRMFQFR